MINQRERAEVSIEGHADSIGAIDYNQRLSTARAETVKRWMVAHRVSRAELFRVKGWGESKPIVPNKKADGSDNPEGRRLNRRVEIIFGGS